MNVCYSMDLSKSIRFFFIYTRTQTLKADRKYVAMSVFICTLLNRPKFSVFALSLWLEFIRAAFVVIFSPNPFNIIILLTGINCLHISTLDIFGWSWMAENDNSAVEHCTLAFIRPIKLFGKEKVLNRDYMPCVNVGWISFRTFMAFILFVWTQGTMALTIYSIRYDTIRYLYEAYVYVFRLKKKERLRRSWRKYMI